MVLNKYFNIFVVYVTILKKFMKIWSNETALIDSL